MPQQHSATGMSDYRLFAVNDRDEVLWLREIACTDDDEAEALALTAGSCSFEVWDVGRLVAKYDNRHASQAFSRRNHEA